MLFGFFALFPLLQVVTESPRCMHAGNLLTTDPGGPYNFSMLNTQTTEVRGVSFLVAGIVQFPLCAGIVQFPLFAEPVCRSATCSDCL